jgi:hypothetical protein
VSQPAGGNAIISNPAIVNPTMTVQNVGDYVLQLQASGGGQSDTAQTKFTVTETPFTADFTPVDQGSAGVDFSTGNRGDIILQSNTSVFATGSPVSCSWTVISGPGVSSPGVGLPGGPTLDNQGTTLTSTKACMQFVQVCFPPFGCFNFPVNASATLNVPSSALNGQYVVQFTASTVTSQTTTHAFTVAENPPVPSISVTSPTTLAFSLAANGRPRALISLSGSSTGVTPLTFAWSIDSAPGGSVDASTITTGASTSTLTARATGSYTVRLTVTDANGVSGATTSTFTVATGATTFSTIIGDLTSFGCSGCHIAANGEPGVGSGIAPSWVSDGSNAGNVALWQRVFARVVVPPGTVNNSLFLENPSNTDPSGHGGGCRPGFNTLGNAANTSPNFCPDTSVTNYNSFRSWILNGAPPGN